VTRAAVAFRDSDRRKVIQLLAQLRCDLGRRPGDALHWVNIRGHGQRLHAARSLGQAAFLTISSVVVCKRHFNPDGVIHEEDVSYLYTLRYLLERLSWLGRLRGGVHARLRWSYLRPGRIDQPQRVEELQLADLAASATAAAFEPDRFGNTEPRYLREMAPRLYRHNGNLTSYGLKMHPWSAAAQAAYPWVHAL